MSNDPTPWWKQAVTYQVYVRSFADGNDDGIGDLAGIRSRLPYLAELGVDAVWITPFYPTPDYDHGYDVADYCDIDPRLGSLAEADALLADAHALGLRILVDLVPNHSSHEHAWFKAAMADPESPERDWYIFRPGRGDGSPPNNWGSVFGGAAWSPSGRPNEWYLHLFTPEQPDLNWRNPDVVAAFDDILRFWFDRGVDGMRIDVAHGLLKDADLRDNPVWDDDVDIYRPPPKRAVGSTGSTASGGATTFEQLRSLYSFDQEEVHDVYRHWRALVDSYDGDRALVGEVFLWDPARVARYVRPDELHLAFNFYLLGQAWEAEGMRKAIDLTLGELGAVDATPTWVLSNHDVIRHATRYGGGDLGQQRARAAALLLLGLPGAAYVYQGDELGLEEVNVPEAARQDPVFFRTNGARAGRDGCRVPIPWTSQTAPGYGFTNAEPWLPTPEGWGARAVDAQEKDPDSMLALYRQALRARKDTGFAGAGALRWLETGPDVLSFARTGSDGRDRVVAINFGDSGTTERVVGELLVASDG